MKRTHQSGELRNAYLWQGALIFEDKSLTVAEKFRDKHQPEAML
jgi:hypothetical protein